MSRLSCKDKDKQAKFNKLLSRPLISYFWKNALLRDFSIDFRCKTTNFEPKRFNFIHIWRNLYRIEDHNLHYRVYSPISFEMLNTELTIHILKENIEMVCGAYTTSRTTCNELRCHLSDVFYLPTVKDCSRYDIASLKLMMSPLHFTNLYTTFCVGEMSRGPVPYDALVSKERTSLLFRANGDIIATID
jgi:hypothetical protein